MHRMLASVAALVLSLAISPVWGQEPVRIAMIEGLSGPMANGGEAALRNVRLAVEQINAQGGVALPGGKRPLEIVTFDSKSGVEDALVQLRRVTDQRIPFVIQGNSSAVAAALVDAVDKHNRRVPDNRVLFLNYSAVDPALTNNKCSFWHFRFDAHAGMRMHALTEVIRRDTAAKRVYLIGQDYSFGHEVAREARAQIVAKRPDIQVVGEMFHPIGKVKDFAPYIDRIRHSGADTVVTGNWSNDLTLLVRAARDARLHVKFYTFYGNGLGAPAAIGDAGVGQVRAVAEWHPNAGQPGSDSDRFYQDFRQRYPKPEEDYVHVRYFVMMRMLADAITRAGTTEPGKVALAMEGARFDNGFHQATMRAADHQLIQPLHVSVMRKLSDGRIRFDNEGSGYGFETELLLPPAQAALPSSCMMKRPDH